MFGSGALYHPAVYAAVVGIILPVPFWLLGKRYPKRIWRMVHFGVLLNSLLSIPPASGINYASCLSVGFIFREYSFPQSPGGSDGKSRISTSSPSFGLVVQSKLGSAMERGGHSGCPVQLHLERSARFGNTALCLVHIFDSWSAQCYHSMVG
jgi:hypothetical protein